MAISVYNFFVSIKLPIYFKTLDFCIGPICPIGPIIEDALDINPRVSIMAAFYETPSMPHDCFLRVVEHAILLRTTDHAGAKSTPNTPLIFQEIK